MAGNRGDLPALLSEEARTVRAAATCRLTLRPMAVLQSYKRTGTNCPKGGDKLSQPPATISGWGKVPKDVLRSDISPAAKLVFAAIASEMYDRKTVEMTHAEIGACCHIAARHVKRSIKVLVAGGLVEQRRLSAGCVYQYRLLHAEFGGQRNPQSRSSEGCGETPVTVAASIAIPVCAQCHLPRRRLHRSGICRGCKDGMDLASRVKEIRAELGSDASPEQIAERLKQIAEDRGRRRLTARVRRVMESVA